jgi:hypothetical protein
MMSSLCEGAKLVTSKFARRTQIWHGFWFLTLRYPYGICYSYARLQPPHVILILSQGEGCHNAALDDWMLG